MGALIALLAIWGCKPTSVADAEAKGDVGYLVANGSPEAVAALGRLADKSEKAKSAIETRAEGDLNAYIAAWTAVQRGAAWGTEILKAGLRQPARAEMAASAMTRRDPKLADFVPDFETALILAPPGEPRIIVSAMLASTAASGVVQGRLRDKATRANMCRGLASPDASATSRQVLLTEPPASRDDPACMETLVRLASLDDATMDWLATQGEPGLLSGAGKMDAMPCPRLAQTWITTIGKRPVPTHGSLAVPLAHAIKRCPAALDAVLDAALKTPGATPLVVSAVDPYGPETRDLKVTCKSLANAVRTTTGRTKDRATDTLAHGCKGR